MAEAERATSVHRTRLLPVLAPDRVPRVVPTPAQPLIISVSELSDFLRCRSRWYWRYLAGLRRKTDSKNYRAIGIIVHEIKESWYKLPPNKRYKKGAIIPFIDAHLKTTKLKGLNNQTRTLVRAMCLGFSKWARTEDKEIGLGVCAPEEWFMLPLVEDGSVMVRGKIDNRFEPTNRKRTLACVETKTKSKFDVATIDLNFQLSTYLWALRQQHPKYRKYIAHFTILKRQMPGPRVKAALFYRMEVSRDDDEIDRWVQDVRNMAKDMLAPRIYPNVQGSCAWDCDFYNPCLLRSTPGDLKNALKSEYTQTKEDR